MSHILIYRMRPCDFNVLSFSTFDCRTDAEKEKENTHISKIMIIGQTLKAANQSTLMNEKWLKSSFTFNQVVKLLPLFFFFLSFFVLCFLYLSFPIERLTSCVFLFHCRALSFLRVILPFTLNTQHQNVEWIFYINNHKIIY